MPSEISLTRHARRKKMFSALRRKRTYRVRSGMSVGANSGHSATA